MIHATNKELDYFAGNINGDGSISVGANLSLRLCLDKAEKSQHVLERAKELFGGTIYLKKKKTATNQNLYAIVWNGPDAFECFAL
jgi:hypothetical protein